MSRRRIALTGLVAASFALTACSSTGGRPQTQETSGAAAPAPTMTVAMVTHSAQGDTFWDIVRRGAEDAAEKDGIRLEYTSDPDGAGQANLVKQAVDKKVDGIVVTLAKPDAMAANVKAATAAGIPVTAINAGSDRWKTLGVLGFYGQEERLAGKGAGERLKADGATKVLCVIHEQGNVGHESRCAGVKDGLPNTEKLYVVGSDTADVQAKITAKLQQDKDVTDVITLGGPFAMTAITAIKEAGRSDVRLTTFDLSKDVVGAVKDGKIAWAVDQQPYLQGYLAVDAIWLSKTNGNEVGGGQAVLTGPAFVDAQNVASVEKFAAEGRR